MDQLRPLSLDLGAEATIMVIRRPVFTTTRDQAERDQDTSRVLSIRFSHEELRELEEVALIIQQQKAGSVVKFLCELGLIHLHDPLTTRLLTAVFKNAQRNRRTGITIPNPEFIKK